MSPIYFKGSEAPDNVGHTFGPKTPERIKIIEQIDRIIGYLREAIHKNGLTDHLNVILSSDHGMTTVKMASEVNEIKLRNYMSLFNLARFDLLDYGGFGMITPREGKGQEVYDSLKNAHPNLTVYKQEEIPEHFHIRKHERIQPIVLLADLGFNINSVSLFENKYPSF
ncbi:ectonucleotide pyrophosphatase/phosphodiesterase family member 7-like [Sinocyclocheilus grahami]|uniref:ectonucleotide pyrophosphatase/phosphodiesterase family member 7-like n=1 Tax=Sinocyclocheilus grahami TaxID=75366 RepID=UPI0007AD4A30|nr:PREDICTED: ectonucleotide pyrophosphatase/phosphodiesterase family member 7-like [Sinocyclocheilus grahami]